MDRLSDFLTHSPIAEQTKLPATVVIKRMHTSSAELLSIKEKGEFGPLVIDGKKCELEIGGQVVARGRIVRNRGKLHFRVTENMFEIELQKVGEK